MQVDPPDPPDLTGKLKLARIVGTGSCSVVHLCWFARNVKVAVKAVGFTPSFDPTKKSELIRTLRHVFGMWKRLEHPNIVPLLGITYDKYFGSDFPCIVLTWMTNGTLNEYLKQHGTKLSLRDRVQLIKGTTAGLEYLHSQGIVHGNFHPGNIMIDNERNARLTDFGLSPSLFPLQDQSSYLWIDSIRPSWSMWTAPELLYLKLRPELKSEATFKSDIYSLGSIFLLTLSGKYPWRDGGEAENKLKEFQNPPRSTWPVNMPNGVWDYIERCWSPRDPGSRPSAQEVLSFCTDRLEQSLLPKQVDV